VTSILDDAKQYQNMPEAYAKTIFLSYADKDWHDPPGSYCTTKQSSLSPLAALLALSSLARTALSPQNLETPQPESLPELGPATPNEIRYDVSRAVEFHYKSLEQGNGTAGSYKRLSEEWMSRAVHAVAESGFNFDKYWALVSTFIEREGGSLNGSSERLQGIVNRTSVKLRALTETEGMETARDRLYSSLMGALDREWGRVEDLLYMSSPFRLIQNTHTGMSG
jgi:hypothetical protein